MKNRVNNIFKNMREKFIRKLFGNKIVDNLINLEQLYQDVININNNLNKQIDNITIIYENLIRTNNNVININNNLTKTNNNVITTNENVLGVNEIAKKTNDDVKETNENVLKTNENVKMTNGNVDKVNNNVIMTNENVNMTNGNVDKVNNNVIMTNENVNMTKDNVKITNDNILRANDIAKWTNDNVKKVNESVIKANDIAKWTNDNVKKGNDKSDEILWAEIFNNTINDSDWLKNKTFSPGRWAAGYAFLYILYRSLRDTESKCILELGLGDTTRVISQYVSEHKNVEHFVAENNQEWIDFFKYNFKIPDRTKIVKLQLSFLPYKEYESIRIYDGFYENFKNKKYDLICIDGPQGSDMTGYARIDVLSLLPENLSSSFIIFVDDYNRTTEQNMVNDMLEKLDKANIPYFKAIYKGLKQTLIICSEDKKFLLTL